MTRLDIESLYDGIAFEDVPLTVSVAGDALPAMTDAKYIWFANGVQVAAGSAASYTPDDAQVGKMISVGLTYTDGAGKVQQLTASGAVKVVEVNDRPSGTVSYLADAGQWHAAVDIQDGDGLGTFSYQWKADGVALPLEIRRDMDVAHHPSRSNLSVEVSYVDGHGHRETVNSDAPAGIWNDHWGTVTVTGTFAAGQTLHAAAADQDGLGQVYYAWQASSDGTNWTDIAGALGSDYAVTAASPPLLRSNVVYADNEGYVEKHGTVFGSAGADTLSTAGVDTIYAGAGNDRIVYKGSNSRVDGGAGLDTFVSADTAGYARQPDGTVVVGTNAGEATTLVNVERVLLAGGGAVAFDVDGSAGQAYRLYQAAFNRVPDAVGEGFWMARLDGGIGLTAVANAFVDSAEFKSQYGGAPTNAKLVEQFYTNILHRAPDATGQAFWTGVLDSHAATAADVLAHFGESDENVAALIGTMQAGMKYAPYGGA